MCAQETSRSKKSNDKASNIILKRGFGIMVTNALKEFGLDLVHGTKAIGPSGEATDWPINITEGGKDRVVYHIDAPCYETGVISLNDSIMGGDDWNMAHHNYRALKVPPNLIIWGDSDLRFVLGNGHGYTSYQPWGEKSVRVAMDKDAARGAARDLALQYIDYVNNWLSQRSQARKVINNELERREATGKDGQGRHWFVSRETRWHRGDREHVLGYSVTWGNCSGRFHFKFMNDGEESGATVKGKFLTPSQVKDLRATLGIPAKQELASKETADEYLLGDWDDQYKWMEGLPMNEVAALSEIKLAWAHKMMRVDVPPMMTVPRKFRKVKEQYDNSNLKGEWAAEKGLPWKPLNPETIAEL